MNTLVSVLIAAVCLLCGYMAVSYTHLDVYKRPDPGLPEPAGGHEDRRFCKSYGKTEVY